MYITKAQLNTYGRGFSLANDYIANRQQLATASNERLAETTIFLSHSHKDKEMIQPALGFLRSHGVKIYVDWMDHGMPDTVSGETAKNIKHRIKQHKKFLVMVTENSKDSRWVPWELGYADSTKGMDHIASFPVADSYTFTNNEYLSIYPKIYLVNGTWYVWTDDPSNLVELKNWLRS